MYGKPKGVKEVRKHGLDTGGFKQYDTRRYYDSDRESHVVYQAREEVHCQGSPHRQAHLMIKNLE